MKSTLLLLFMVYSFTLMAQGVYNVDHVTPITEMVPNSLDAMKSYDFEITDDGSKYDLGFFQGSYLIANEWLSTNGLWPNDYSIGLRISRFDAQNNYVKSKKIVQGDSIMHYKMIAVHNTLFVMIEFQHELQLSNDTIFSKGYNDVCILKVDSNLNVTDKLVIGNHNRDYIPQEAFVSANDHVYFALNFFSYDTSANTYDHYALQLGNDTVYADTSLETQGMEYVLCKMDTNLHIVNYKSMGGTKHNGCQMMMVNKDRIYIVGQTMSGALNRIGDSIVTESVTIQEPKYLASLNEDFSFKWWHFMGSIGIGCISTLTTALGVGSNYIFIQTHNNPSPWCTGLVYVDGAGYYGEGVRGICFDTNGVFNWSKKVDHRFRTSNFKIPSNGLAVFPESISDNAIVDGTVMHTCSTSQSGLLAIDMIDGSLLEVAALCEDSWPQYHTQVFRITYDANEKLYFSAKTNANLLTSTNTYFPMATWSTLYYYASMDSMEIFPAQISEQNETSTFAIYPNPTKGNLTISIPDEMNAVEIKIVNVFGQTIYHHSLKDSFRKHLQLDVNDFGAGNYQFMLIDEKGQCVTQTFSKY